MRKTLYVIKNELLTTLGRPSYILITFGLPLLGVLVFFIISMVRGEPSAAESPETDSADAFEFAVEGYIDRSGLIESIPADVPTDVLIPYPDEQLAQQALESGDIEAYYLIPADYLETGELYYIRPEYTPFSSDSQDWVMRWTLLYNVTGGDIDLASYVWHPMNENSRDLSAAGTAADETDACLTAGYGCEENMLLTMLPLAVLVLFFIFISASAGLLLRSVSSEKQNRTLETLMLSLNPRQLLAGKIIGLGIVAVMQVMVWVGSMFVILRIGGRTLNLPEGFTLPVSILIWALLFFISGYAIYASLMAGLGALVPDIKSGTQASIIVILPLLIGYVVSVFPPVQEAPHGLLATVLSIFPFTAPPVMMMRLTVGGVPLWQLLLAIGLSIITVIIVIRAVAGMFRAQTMLSGQPFSPRRYFSALLGRA